MYGEIVSDRWEEIGKAFLHVLAFVKKPHFQENKKGKIMYQRQVCVMRQKKIGRILKY